MRVHDDIIETVLQHYPSTQAIYLFGSYGTEYERPESDADIALLLPPDLSPKTGYFAMSRLSSDLESLLKRDVDLINLRQASTVLRKEVVAADRRIYTGDGYAADEFEMLTLSLYQKLNEERAGIVKDAMAGGRLYQV
ncbi:MAG: nucleotidyltransferase domain-containing protein [Geobacteraceae bacterium]|nr:nucleotidyltransferase domain-containing protein [Geobacteraceae bacterium]